MRQVQAIESTHVAPHRHAIKASALHICYVRPTGVAGMCHLFEHASNVAPCTPVWDVLEAAGEPAVQRLLPRLDTLPSAHHGKQVVVVLHAAEHGLCKGGCGGASADNVEALLAPVRDVEPA